MSYANIRGKQGGPLVRYFSDLANFRHLAINLVGSDLRARFRRSRLGIVWAIVQPLAFSMVIGFVWGGLFNYDSVWEFSLYVFSGMLIWEYFTNCVLTGQDSIVAAEGYIRQTSIPFLIFQVRTPLSSLVILLAGCVGLLAFETALDALPAFGPHLLLIPAYFGVLLMFGLPVTILMSILGVQFRDMKYISMITVQALFFVTPVMLGREMLARPELWFMKFVNPVVPLIDLFRAPIVNGEYWDLETLATMGAWIAILWVLAIIASSLTGRRLIYSL